MKTNTWFLNFVCDFLHVLVLVGWWVIHPKNISVSKGALHALRVLLEREMCNERKSERGREGGREREKERPIYIYCSWFSPEIRVFGFSKIPTKILEAQPKI